MWQPLLLLRHLRGGKGAPSPQGPSLVPPKTLVGVAGGEGGTVWQVGLPSPAVQGGDRGFLSFLCDSPWGYAGLVPEHQSIPQSHMGCGQNCLKLTLTEILRHCSLQRPCLILHQMRVTFFHNRPF